MWLKSDAGPYSGLATSRAAGYAPSPKKVQIPSHKGFFRLVVSTGNLKNTRQEKDWKSRMKINLCITAVLLATLVLTAGCAVDPYASGPDMGTEIPPGGAPASGTGYR